MTSKQNETAVVGLQDQEAGQQQLEVCLHEFGFSAMTAQEFIEAGVDYINQATAYACRAGVAFWAAQEALKESSAPERTKELNSTTPERSRSFKEWIDESGLTEMRVYECIRIAKFYARLPEASRAKALTIGKKHALLLASLPQEVIDQAAESGNDLIEKADMMTVSELKAEIKSAQNREKNYDAELERLRLQVARLSKEKSRTTTFLLRTEEIREECMALGLGVELNLNSLQKLFEELNAEDTRLPEWRLQMETIWVAAHIAAARATDMIELLRNNVAVDGMPDRVMGQHQLTADEAARWVLDSALIANRHEAQTHLRQMRREEAQPRGRGRPKNPSSKVAGA